MSLSVHTLQFTDSVVFLTCGLVFLCHWVSHREKLSFLLFGSSFLFCAVMSVEFDDFGRYDDWVAPLGWTLAGTLFWIGFRVFDGRTPVTPVMVVLAALPTVLQVTLLAFGQGAETVNLAITLAYALHEAALACYVLSTSRGSMIRRVAGLALAAIVVSICLPALPLRADLVELTLVAIAITDHVTSIVLTTAILALESERAYARLEEIAHCDPLTGALNRKGFDRATERSGDWSGVIIADLDHFKRVNDRYGHAAGDHVLREFVGRARSVLPGCAVLARFGGEEFVAVLNRRDPSDLPSVAERLRFAIQNEPIEWCGHAIALTVSLGAATTDKAATIGAALERADAALYEAKLSGRNRVQVASSGEKTVPEREERRAFGPERLLRKAADAPITAPAIPMGALPSPR
ncbi:GGDEF domain-containing protein [Fulvimarina endophytica]|uniref:diguanylate cyclase n=1 Tax=Fulvimarina endophytica TaxID=2293836 RepID=A0A371WYG1_9HYPH|nr:GGDEF domain-containing protein [Fulvimarina endophytica]RFC62002.1 GGDEF domain-containing protein [Fulvimarina endophytica]